MTETELDSIESLIFNFIKMHRQPSATLYWDTAPQQVLRKFLKFAEHYKLLDPTNIVIGLSIIKHLFIVLATKNITYNYSLIFDNRDIRICVIGFMLGAKWTNDANYNNASFYSVYHYALTGVKLDSPNEGELRAFNNFEREILQMLDFHIPRDSNLINICANWVYPDGYIDNDGKECSLVADFIEPPQLDLSEEEFISNALMTLALEGERRLEARQQNSVVTAVSCVVTPLRDMATRYFINPFIGNPGTQDAGTQNADTDKAAPKPNPYWS